MTKIITMLFSCSVYAHCYSPISSVARIIWNKSNSHYSIVFKRVISTEQKKYGTRQMQAFTVYQRKIGSVELLWHSRICDAKFYTFLFWLLLLTKPANSTRRNNLQSWHLNRVIFHITNFVFYNIYVKY